MNYDSPTLVILTPGFPSDEGDTTCLPLQQALIKKLKQQSPELKIIVLSFQYPFTTEAYTWNNIPVIPFGGNNKGGLSRLLLWRKVSKQLDKIRKGNYITGILSFWCGECALAGKRFSMKYNIRHYSWILGQDAGASNKYVKWIDPSGDELIALSDFVQQEFDLNHGIKPQHIVPPGIDLSEFGAEHEIKDIDIIGAGSLIPLKQFDVFLHVIHAIKKERPQIKAVICGDGPEKKKLQLLIDQLKLQENVIITGELPHSILLQWMQRSKILLHPSSYEGFGVVCIEALHSGASVISFCQPMNILPPNWYAVDDPNEMAALVGTLLQNPIHSTKLADYSIHRTAKKMLSLFGYQLHTETV